ncbi:MAG TPA: hypothetical protein VHW46_01435 [Terracidiphilus sp.]|nr:hypothetical protein [Terracidiphilus sp.]
MRDSMTMLDKAVIVGFDILEGLFFTGLVGCSMVVVISWISIAKSGFSEDHPSDL